MTLNVTSAPLLNTSRDDDNHFHRQPILVPDSPFGVEISAIVSFHLSVWSFLFIFKPIPDIK